MLLLFDIDGTLLQGASDAHAAAIHEAIAEIWGVDVRAARPTLEAAGRTDLEISRALLTALDVPARDIDAGMGRLRTGAAEAYARLVPGDLSDRVTPGVPELLAGLDRRDGVLLSLLTGNLEAVARLKLRAAGLSRWFPAGQGAFGSDSEDRTRLPAVARARAGADGEGRRGGRGSYPRERTVVIGDTPHIAGFIAAVRSGGRRAGGGRAGRGGAGAGARARARAGGGGGRGAPPRERPGVIGDTPRDVACARADGVRCIGVTTGPCTAADLAGGDEVVAGAREVAGALERLGL